jgi:hypothetical protein
MSKIVAAIFADRAKAHDGALALKDLAASGVEVRASAIVSKGSDSELSVLEDSYYGFRATAAAALIGGLAHTQPWAARKHGVGKSPTRR